VRPGLAGGENTDVDTAKYSSLVMMMLRWPYSPPPSYEEMTMTFVFKYQSMILRYLSVDSPIAFGGMLYGKPTINSYGVDAFVVGVRRACVATCCGNIN
jgi:hypothetical protein